MPRSKHRRKTGGKAVKKPGLAKQAAHSPAASLEHSAADQAWNAFFTRYIRDVEIDIDDEGAVGYMTDLILDGAVYEDGGTLQFRPVSKAAIFEQFTNYAEEDVPDEFGDFTHADAETALAYLVNHDLAAVDGDQITIPAQHTAEP